MPWLVVGAGVFGMMAIVAWMDARRGRATQQERYREKVGLDLAGLIALLPDELRTRDYVDFMVAPKVDEVLRVGLVLKNTSGVVPPGTPANVGLEFDAVSGALLKVHPKGVGLGLK